MYCQASANREIQPTCGTKTHAVKLGVLQHWPWTNFGFSTVCFFFFYFFTLSQLLFYPGACW